MPPRQRVPVAPPNLTVARIDRDVYVRFTVPSVNVDGEGPADVAVVEVYALTADRVPEIEDPEDLRNIATLVASEPVRRPQPPSPAADLPSVPTPAPEPGSDQGAIVTLREALTVDHMRPVTLPERTREPEPVADRPGPQIAPRDSNAPSRYYFAVAVSPRGRYGPPTHLAPAPLGDTSSAPPSPTVTFDEKTMTISWTPAADARGVVEPAPPDVLPSKPVVPGPEPTTYDVYEVSREAPSDSGRPALPVPLTEAPVGATTLTRGDITLGSERCFVVRPVDIVSGIHVRGPASPIGCASFADSFAPSPPGRLDAFATGGMISLVWETSAATDLAGYLVLRAEAGGGSLTPLMTEPLPAATYRDDSVRAGVRYVYAVVAVDMSGNRSEETNRVEETARQ